MVLGAGGEGWWRSIGAEELKTRRRRKGTELLATGFFVVAFLFFVVGSGLSSASAAPAKDLLLSRLRWWISTPAARLESPRAEGLTTANGEDASQTCEEVGCVLEGQSCDGDLFVTEKCSECCALGLHCFEGQCQRSNFGSSCSTGSDCFANGCTNCIQCLSGQCSAIVYAGDSCDSSDHCLGNSVCDSDNKTCTGVALGGACSNPIGECAFGTYCDGNTCVAQKADGSPCANDFECSPRSVCSGQCLAVWSLPPNSPCTGTPSDITDAFFGPCQLNSHCENDTCMLNEDTDDGAQLRSCSGDGGGSGDDGCPNSDCLCDPFAGSYFCGDPFFTVTSSCGIQLQSMLNCTVQFECLPPTLDFASESCVMRHCSAEVDSMLDCLCPLFQQYYSSCLYFPFGDCPAQKRKTLLKIVGISVGVLIIVLLLAVLVFRWYRRRRLYYQVLE